MSEQPNPLDGILDALVERMAPKVAEMVAAILAGSQRPAPGASEVDPGRLVDRRDAARALGVSLATLDRFARDGAPVHQVGSRRRFIVAELRAWLETRGRRPAAQAPTEGAALDDELLAAAGLRRR